jgi:hypothetical protein
VNKKLVSLAATAVLLVTSLVTLAAPASAAVSGDCDGRLIDTADIRAGGTSYGTLRLYYNASARTNCAKAVKAERLVGPRHQMSVWVIRCREGTGTTVNNCDPLDQPSQNINYDSGRYTTYAGPVHNKGFSDGLCLRVGALMEVGSALPDAAIGGHCG